MEDFSELYGEENVAKDRKKVRDIKSRFEEDKNKIPATVLEAIVMEQSELSEWFGPHASTLRTTEFDDFVNGVDLVVEFNEPERSSSHLALGVDVTFGASTIQKKFRRIKDEIDAGQLASVKYFRSQNSRFQGRLSQIPRIVIGIEKENLQNLAALWVQGKKKELGIHPVQRLILVEARRQLETFAKYAADKGKKELAAPYAYALALVDEILKQKSAIQLGELEDDRVFQEIMESARSFNKEDRRA